MRVPIQWLKDYVNISGIDVKTLDEKLVMSGSNTETIIDIKGAVEKVVVGHILSIEQHPDADKLTVCKVDIGLDAPLQIVTGAKNMREGDYVPVALDGAKLAGDLNIKTGKLRGQVSEGMFCSYQELGFDDKVIPKAFADGLLIMDKPYPLGADVFSVLGLDDQVILFEITPNRPDCLSMIGMAREVAATFDLPVMLPDTSLHDEIQPTTPSVKVTVEDSNLCPRYACRVVEKVTVGPSPQWLQSKLIKAGMRPINNVVDITNFVLLEYGQPIHAFDLDRLAGPEIIVRHAMEGEEMETLDGVNRKLRADMLVIADQKRPVAIAGVMGGQDTEVSDQTVNLLIEVANFNKSSIRETSKVLGLRSEASSRYEKGVSPEIVEDALNRVCHLIEKLGCGKVVNQSVDVYLKKHTPEQIVVRPDRINQILGTKLTIEEIQGFFMRIECTVVPLSTGLGVTPPSYRLDLLKEIDFVEEVARLYGYDQLEDTLPQDASFGSYTKRQKVERTVRDNLTGQGLNEICTYSFVSPKILDLLCLPQDAPWRQNVVIRNPLGEEYSVMRPTLLANLLAVISRNAKRQVEETMLYEIGNTFKPRTWPVVDEPIEERRVAIGLMGEDVDFFRIKGVVEGLLGRMKIKSLRFVPLEDSPVFHPGRTALVYSGDHCLGTVGEIHPQVLKQHDLTKRVLAAELDFECILNLANDQYLFESLPKFPAATRDLAFTIDRQVSNQAVIDVIHGCGGALLDGVSLFDVYQGAQIDASKKSMAYALSFRAPDRTLVDEEIQGAMKEILRQLETQLGAVLRQ